MRKLHLLGRAADFNAVYGIYGEDTESPRPVLIVLNEEKSDARQRAYIQSARLNAPNAVMPLAGEGLRNLREEFGLSANDDLTGRVDDAYDAEAVLNIMFEDDQSSMMVLDCRNKDAFWATLKGFDVEREELFALAELDAFTRERTVTNSRKPIVRAHELCRRIAATPQGFFGRSNMDFLNLVRSSVKVKAPGVSATDEMALAVYHRDLAINSGDYPDMKMAYKGSLVINNAFRSVGKLLGRNMPHYTVTPIRGDLARQMFEIKHEGLGAEKHNPLDMPIDFTSYMVLVGPEYDVEAELQAYYGHVSQIVFDKHREPLLELEYMCFPRLLFRDGDYTLPYPKMTIEIDLGYSTPDRVDTHFVLMEMDGQDIVMNVYGQRANEDNYFLYSEEVRVSLDENGQIEQVRSHCRRDDKDMNFRYCSLNPIEFCVGQSLSTLARMNEPDFVEHVVKPERGAKSAMKGHFPYFQAIDISDFGPAQGLRAFSADGASETMALHRVRRHRRRIFDRETGALKEIVPVRSHLRGSAAAGAKVNAIDLS